MKRSSAGIAVPIMIALCAAFTSWNYSGRQIFLPLSGGPAFG
jgi:hypothetical protein